MRPIFRGFCINRFVIGSLHYISSHSDFLLRIRGYICNRKTIPRLADFPTRRVGESLTCFSSFFDYEYLREFKVKIERLVRKWKGLMRNQFLQKPQKIRLIAMSLSYRILPISFLFMCCRRAWRRKEVQSAAGCEWIGRKWSHNLL